MSGIAENLAAVNQQIEQECARCGRDPHSVTLLAVSKTFPAADVETAFQAGQLLFGENRVQELELKAPVLSPRIQWHLIGHLQTNKAAKAAQFADWIHSVDSEKLLLKLDHAAGELGRSIHILLEVNIPGEASKSGASVDSVEALSDAACRAKNLKFEGLMTMAEFGVPSDRIRRTFAGLRELRDRLQIRTGLPLPVLSMGMSGDFSEAIAEGSTMVRIGTAIFGGRS